MRSNKKFWKTICKKTWVTQDWNLKQLAWHSKSFEPLENKLNFLGQVVNYNEKWTISWQWTFKSPCASHTRDGPHFWPAVIKRPTRLWPGYFLTQPKDIFFDPKGKNWKFGIFRGNFPNPNQRWLTQPEQQKIDLTRPRPKNFDLDSSLSHTK